MRTETTYTTCDECGAIDATELRFSTHGGNYMIDLCPDHMRIFENLIRPYVENGTRVKRTELAVRRDVPKAKAKASTNGDGVSEKPRARRHRGKDSGPVDNG